MACTTVLVLYPAVIKLPTTYRSSGTDRLQIPPEVLHHHCQKKELFCPNRFQSRHVKLFSLYGEKSPVALRPRDLAPEGPWEVCRQPHPVSDPCSCAGEFTNLSPVCPVQTVLWRGGLATLLERTRECQGQERWCCWEKFEMKEKARLLGKCAVMQPVRMLRTSRGEEASR